MIVISTSGPNQPLSEAGTKIYGILGVDRTADANSVCIDFHISLRAVWNKENSSIAAVLADLVGVEVADGVHSVEKRVSKTIIQGVCLKLDNFIRIIGVDGLFIFIRREKVTKN